MRNISFMTTVFLSLLLNCSCGAGVSDTTKELSGEYIYVKSGRHQYITANNIFKEGIYPNVTHYVFDENFIIALQNPSLDAFKVFLADELRSRYNIFVNLKDTSELLKGQYNFLKTQLLADSTLYRMLSKRLSPRNTSKDIQESQSIAESLIKSSLKYKLIFSRKLNYWIIKVQNGDVYGPFSKEEYLINRKNLGIPDKLKIENE